MKNNNLNENRLTTILYAIIMKQRKSSINEWIKEVN